MRVSIFKSRTRLSAVAKRSPTFPFGQAGATQAKRRIPFSLAISIKERVRATTSDKSVGMIKITAASALSNSSGKIF